MRLDCEAKSVGELKRMVEVLRGLGAFRFEDDRDIGRRVYFLAVALPICRPDGERITVIISLSERDAEGDAVEFVRYAESLMGDGSVADVARMNGEKS